MLPLVNKIAAGSTALHTKGVFKTAPFRKTSDHRTPKMALPTVMVFLMEVLPHPKRILAICASGIPMKASGLTSLRQEPIPFNPSPGSTTTTVAPMVKSEKTTWRNSMPGLTMTATRIPG